MGEIKSDKYVANIFGEIILRRYKPKKTKRYIKNLEKFKQNQLKSGWK